MAAEDPDEGADILAEAEADSEKSHMICPTWRSSTLLDGEHDERNAVVDPRRAAWTPPTSPRSSWQHVPVLGELLPDQGHGHLPTLKRPV